MPPNTRPDLSVPTVAMPSPRSRNARPLIAVTQALPVALPRLLRRGSYGRATSSIYHPWPLPRLPFYLPPSSAFYPIQRDQRTHARADAREFVRGRRAAIVLIPPPPSSSTRPSPASKHITPSTAPLPILESPRTTRDRQITVRTVLSARELPSPRHQSNLITNDSTTPPLSLLLFPRITQQNVTVDNTTKYLSRFQPRRRCHRFLGAYLS